MKKQIGILQYFKPAQAVKRTLDEKPCNASKHIKTDDNNSDELDSNVMNSTEEKLVSLRENLGILDVKMGPSWFHALQSECSKPYFKKLSDFIVNERKSFKIYPEHGNVWAWSKLCSISSVKVVIIGQDPYHNPGQAHGLCFSVPRGIAPPPSLLNIYKELKSDIDGFVPPSHGDLTKWAKQGVLLLNASLTVRQNSPNSHADQGWEKLTDAVIKAVSDANKGVVFLLWGNFAHKKAACVDKKKHHLLKSVHPSPLSASRGFLGCKHFSSCNRLLEQEGKTPIDWKLD